MAYLKDGCNCAPCVIAGRRNRKAGEYRTVTGTHSHVPADRAREHVHGLLEVLTVGQVQRRSGVDRTAIRVLIGGFPARPASKRITRTTEAALLAVQAVHVGPETGGLVDGTGTRRRLRALVALGWPARHLGDRLGFSSRTNWYLTSPDIVDAAPVRASTRDAVRGLYDELSFTLPPPSRFATRARNLATARGWRPPLAWDDETIDDPRVRPNRGTGLVREGAVFDEIAVERALHGDKVHLRPGERAEVVRRLTAQGLSAKQIAPPVGIDKRSVQRIRDQRRTARAS
jgi:hypothetical protein